MALTSFPMKQPVGLLLVSLLLASCARHEGQGDSGRFYSYVDAQGQLVTVERPLEEAPDNAADVPGSSSAVEQSGVSQEEQTWQGRELTESEYRSSEDIDREMAERDRQRFVAYVDEEGQVQRQEYDREEARAAMENRPRPWEELTTPDAGFVETVRSVRANCCLMAAAQAVELEPSVETRAGIQGSGVTVMLDDRQYPAIAYALPESGASLRIRTYARDGQSYLHPEVIFLDADQLPVLMVDNLFERWFEPNWYRHGYLEGQIPLPDNAAYAVFFLSYAPDGQITAPPEGTVLDYTRLRSAQLGLQGDMTVRLTDGPAGNPAQD